MILFQFKYFRFFFMVFNTSFNNISVLSWRSVLLVEETGVPGENHTPVASHWQTFYTVLPLSVRPSIRPRYFSSHFFEQVIWYNLVWGSLDLINREAIYLCLFVCLMVFNATWLSTIFQLYRGSPYYWWRKLEYLEKTIDELDHIMLYTSPWSRFELTPLVVIEGTEWNLKMCLDDQLPFIYRFKVYTFIYIKWRKLNCSLYRVFSYTQVWLYMGI